MQTFAIKNGFAPVYADLPKKSLQKSLKLVIESEGNSKNLN